jgi:hypothetical protein
MNITTKLVEITPKKATEFLGFLYKNQRPTNQKHVEYLANAMNEGVFDPTSLISFAVLKDSGTLFLIDGQHTLKAICTSAIPQKLLVSHYTVNSDIEIARLYSHFNIGKARTFYDSVRAYGVTERFGLTNTQINQTAAAIRYQLAGFPRTRINKKYQHEYMIQKVEDWLDPALVFFNTIDGSSPMIKRRISSAPSLAVCLNIVKYCPKKGPEFVNLAHDDGLKKGDPRKALLNYIQQVIQGGGSASGLRPQTQGHIARATAKCWGKFFDGLTLNRIRINNLDAGKNIVIKGTPYTGKFPTVG